MLRYASLAAVVILTLVVILGGDGFQQRATAGPATVTLRDPNYGLPHIFAPTDLELARENGREIAKDRLGQIVLLSRVGRGTLFQAFGLLLPLVFSWMVIQCVKIESNQSATGILYAAVVLVLIGEMIGNFLMIHTRFPF